MRRFPSMGRLEVWALVGAVLFFFRRPLTTATFHFRDIELLFYPKKLMFASAIRQGQFPLWDPSLNGGQPYLSPSNSPFYPANVLYLFLSPLTAFNLIIVLHYAAAALAAWWLARTVGLSRTAAFVVGTVYVFCGFTLSSANLLLILFAAPLAPLTLGFVHRAIRDRSRPAFIAAAVCAALPLIAGAPEACGMLFATALAWAAAMSAPTVAWRLRGVAVAASALVFALLLDLVQIRPAVEIAANSARRSGRPFADFTLWSVDPRRLPELVIPRFFGRTDSFDLAQYWGRNMETLHAPYILSIYFGALVVLLALFGGLCRRDGDQLPARTLLAVAVAGVAMSLGRHLPLFRFVYELVPLIDTFRFPVKAVLASVLPLALLAGRGVDLARESESIRARMLLASGAVAASAVALSLVFSANVAFRTWMAASFFGQPAYPLLVRGLTGSLGHVAFFSAVGCAALVLIHRRGGAGTSALAAVVLLDLFLAGASVNSYAPRSLFNPPPIAGVVKKMIGDGRFYSHTILSDAALQVPTSNEVWRSKWVIDSLGRYTAPLFGIPVILHEDYDQLGPVRISRLARAMETLPWARRVDLLRLGAVKAFTTIEDVAVAGVRKVRRVPSIEVHPLYLYSVEGSERARFMSRVVIAGSDHAAFDMLLRGVPPDTLLLEKGEAREGCGTAPVAFAERRFDYSSYRVDAPCAGYVFFSETWYHGWQVKVDGAPAELVRAGYAFSAVSIAPGRHVIERMYVPVALRFGAAGTLVGAVLLALLSGQVLRCLLPPVRPDGTSS